MVNPAENQHNKGLGFSELSILNSAKSVMSRLAGIVPGKYSVKKSAENVVSYIKHCPRIIVKVPASICSLCLYICNFGWSISLAEAALFVKECALNNGLDLDASGVSDGSSILGISSSKVKSKIELLLRRTHGVLHAILLLIAVVLARIASIIGLIVAIPVMFVVGIILLCTWLVLVLVRAVKGGGPVKKNIIEMSMSFPRKIFALFADRVKSDFRMSMLFMLSLFSGKESSLFSQVDFVDLDNGTVYVQGKENSASKIIAAMKLVFGNSIEGV